MQDLDQAEIGEIAVERGGGALAGFLDRMDRELDRNAARIADTRLHAVRQEDVDLVAGGEVAAGLGDADDRLAALQLLAGIFLVQVALDIKRGHPGIVRVVEPFL